MSKRQPHSGSILFEAQYNDSVTLPLANFLKETAQISTRSLRRYFFKGLIFLNQRKAHSAAMLKPGDLVKVYKLDEEFQPLKPEKLPIDIIYENQDLLVLNKPALIAVHPSGNITSGTLANRLAAYFESTGQKLKIRPVNRLDFGTSGLIIFAKSSGIQERLSTAIQDHQIHRIYYTIVKGVPAVPTDTINLPIANVKGQRIVRLDGQPATTHYRVIETFADASLLEVSLETGRTHQIRVHLAHIGYPILGDVQYGTRTSLIKRPALHAGKLNFDLSPIAIPELSAAYPEDFERLLGCLGAKPDPIP